MTDLSRRLSRLERSGARDVTIIAQVPEAWRAEERELAVLQLARDAGLNGSYRSMIFTAADCHAAEISFIGDLGDLLAQVAKEGARIGSRQDATR